MIAPAGSHSDDILILGVGNPLQGDDGVGIQVVEMLAQHNLPSNVHVKEAGVPGWELPAWLEGWSSVILIDAVDMGQKPGAWRCFRPQDVKFLLQDEALSLHQPDLACGLALAEALDMLPMDLHIYGIQPANTEMGTSLSRPVNDCLPGLVEQILGCIIAINEVPASN